MSPCVDPRVRKIVRNALPELLRLLETDLDAARRFMKAKADECFVIELMAAVRRK